MYIRIRSEIPVEIGDGLGRVELARIKRSSEGWYVETEPGHTLSESEKNGILMLFKKARGKSRG